MVRAERWREIEDPAMSSLPPHFLFHSPSPPPPPSSVATMTPNAAGRKPFLGHLRSLIAMFLSMILFTAFGSTTIVNAFAPAPTPRRIETRPLLRMACSSGTHDEPLLWPNATKRRIVLSTISGLMIGGSSPSAVHALFSSDDRRQLELCIVTVLRVSYWAETLATTLQSSSEPQPAYLEARLGAKAVLTGRVGGGANNRVYNLSTLQLRGCLDDAVSYGKKQELQQLRQDLLESLAAVVEFDGLETTQDPSPRSSLMLSMYKPEKATFVKRMLSERFVPTSQAFVDAFGPTVRAQCEAYIRDTYPNEVPTRIKNDAPAIQADIQ